MGGPKHKLAWLQALRGIAAGMVVLVHSRSALLDAGAGKLLADRLLPLAMGVDLFFIISGFLMVLTTRDCDGSAAYARQFAAKRIARIWPLFAVVSVLAVAVEHGFRGYLDAAVLQPYLEGLLFMPHDPAASGIYFRMAVGVAWTLCFECYFYLVFALGMLFGRWRYAAMAAWFGVTLVAVPWLRGHYSLDVATRPLVAWSRYANLAVNPIVWDFIAGMLAAWLYQSDIKIRKPASIYIGVAVLLIALLLAWHRLGMLNFFGPRGWGAPLAILFAGIALRAKLGSMQVPAWLVWLGNISYSLYLMHVYVFELVQDAVSAVPLQHRTAAILLLAIRPLAAVMCAWAVFRYIEAPLSAQTRRLLHIVGVPAIRAASKQRTA
ncbi:acyltransferase family protein [Dyella acidiphila]|uniref:Acyltransferase n=1 Tax=Dyella acidiphila TaxID=2775866 RepID=A0ABR9G9J8_9GAMM|nr:acyltransferase [Dyella acidiphila]MBE1160724.1 acyltransferase [Dyella acidiphila]